MVELVLKPFVNGKVRDSSLDFFCDGRKERHLFPNGFPKLPDRIFDGNRVPQIMYLIPISTLFLMVVTFTGAADLGETLVGSVAGVKAGLVYN